MTLQEIIMILDEHSIYVLVYFLALPLLALFAGRYFSSPLSESGRYTYATIIYAACVPGLFSFTLCAYSLLFERNSFLDVSILIYFLPFITMLITLGIVSKTRSMKHLPGFKRLSGMMMMIIASFVIILILQKMRFWVVFVGSFWLLVLVFIFLFLVIRFGWDKLIDSADEDPPYSQY